MNIYPGLRVGWWRPNRINRMDPAFLHTGYYRGPHLGDVIVGTLMQQNLLEGELKFRVGVLFRPDLGKRDRLETVLLLESNIPEMFEYEDWEKVS